MGARLRAARRPSRRRRSRPALAAVLQRPSARGGGVPAALALCRGIRGDSSLLPSHSRRRRRLGHPGVGHHGRPWCLQGCCPLAAH
eukprot:8091582-Alexandrium_andersonii.AAC.1